MGRAFDATGSYETLLLQLAVVTMAVAFVTLLLPAAMQSVTRATIIAAPAATSAVANS